MATPEENYKFVVDTVDYIEQCWRSDTPKTQEWFDTHFSVMQNYRRVFPSFQKVHQDVESMDMQEKFVLLDRLLDMLISSYQHSRYFSVRDYHKFCQTLLYVIHSFHKEDEVASMFESVSLGGETN